MILYANNSSYYHKKTTTNTQAVFHFVSSYNKQGLDQKKITKYTPKPDLPDKNKHIDGSRISEAKLRQFIKYFTLDLEAQKIPILTRLNLNTVNRYLRLIRERIGEHCEKQSPLKGEIEVDKIYFGTSTI